MARFDALIALVAVLFFATVVGAKTSSTQSRALKQSFNFPDNVDDIVRDVQDQISRQSCTNNCCTWDCNVDVPTGETCTGCSISKCGATQANGAQIANCCAWPCTEKVPQVCSGCSKSRCGETCVQDSNPSDSTGPSSTGPSSTKRLPTTMSSQRGSTLNLRFNAAKSSNCQQDYSYRTEYYTGASSSGHLVWYSCSPENIVVQSDSVGKFIGSYNGVVMVWYDVPWGTGGRKVDISWR